MGDLRDQLKKAKLLSKEDVVPAGANRVLHLVAPVIAATPAIVAFAVIIIGGLGSVEGAAIGAVMVGVSRAASVHLMPEIELFIIYFVMAAVLVFRPEGLFVKTQTRKI